MLIIASIVGTRPEAVKIAPIARAAAEAAHITHHLIASGQQDALFDDAVAAFGIGVDAHLGTHPGGASMDDQVAAIRQAATRILGTLRPDIVLVQGDTNTALAAAQAAHICGIPVGHVEAGLRTHHPDRPYPEEHNRVEIAKLATLHFAPSPGAADNLTAEGIMSGITVTGNTGIDALITARGSRTKQPGGHILVTCHRRENFGAPLIRVCSAIAQIADLGIAPVLFPVHPNPNVSDTVQDQLGGRAGVRLIAPMRYTDMLDAIASARFVISDSGGLQEECAALGIPLLLLREETERPEVIESCNAVLVGSETDIIVQEAMKLLRDEHHHARMSRPHFPYGRGDAAGKVLDAIDLFFARVQRS